jgi:hypothetical protein
MAPNRDIAKPEMIPQQIEHRLIQTQDSVPGDTCRRRGKLCQPVKDNDPLFHVDTSQQMS